MRLDLVSPLKLLLALALHNNDGSASATVAAHWSHNRPIELKRSLPLLQKVQAFQWGGLNELSRLNVSLVSARTILLLQLPPLLHLNHYWCRNCSPSKGLPNRENVVHNCYSAVNLIHPRRTLLGIKGSLILTLARLGEVQAYKELCVNPISENHELRLKG